MDTRQYIRDCYRKGTPVKDIALRLGISCRAVKGRAARDPKCPAHGSFLVNDIIDTERSLKGDEPMRTPTQKESQLLRELCDEHNLPYDQWKMWWYKIPQHSVCFVNKEAIEDEQRRFDDFLERVKKRAPRFHTPKAKKVTDGHLHIVDVADLHVNKLALDKEGNVSYNAEKAVSIAEKAVDSLVTRGKGYNVEQFIFPIGNDILHTEAMAGATTKGTPQTRDRHWTQAIDMAFDMYVRMIGSLLKVAPVKIVHCRDNHAEFASYMLAKQVAAYLHRHKWLTTDISHLDRAYHVYGQNLLGFDHGHGTASAKLPQVVAAEVAQLWGQTRNRYFYRHHVHHADFKRANVRVKQDEVLKDYPGLTIQHMRTPCGTDDYHHNAGYVGVPKAVDSFVIHPTMGQVAHLTCPID